MGEMCSEEGTVATMDPGAQTVLRTRIAPQGRDVRTPVASKTVSAILTLTALATRGAVSGNADFERKRDPLWFKSCHCNIPSRRYFHQRYFYQRYLSQRYFN